MTEQGGGVQAIIADMIEQLAGKREWHRARIQAGWPRFYDGGHGTYGDYIAAPVASAHFRAMSKAEAQQQVLRRLSKQLRSTPTPPAAGSQGGSE